MARYINNGTGNFSSSATWDTVVNTPTIHASTNITITNSDKFTATFTAPNTTNAVTGIMLYVAGVGTQAWNITLQESTVDTACTATVAVADRLAASWIYVRFATPYTYTTTGAGAYRFKIRTASSGTGTIPADSGGTLISYLVTDDRHVAPGVGDDVYIMGDGPTDRTVTVDGTSGSIGSGTNTTALASAFRDFTHSVTIGINGILAWDTTANSTLQVKGNLIVFPGGEWYMGTVASPVPSSTICKLIIDMATSGDHGYGAYSGAKAILQGAAQTSTSLWKTTYSSGSGTAASPLITADAVDWAVGDEIIVAATNNGGTSYNECEYRYIKTKNSSTSYVLSTTVGGAEAALTYTHSTSAVIINLQRNVIITTTSSTKATYGSFQSTVSGDVNFDWTRFDYTGISTANKQGMYSTGQTSLAYGSCDYSVFYKLLYYGFIDQTSTTTETKTGLVAVGGQSGHIAGMIFNSSRNKTYNDCFVMDCQGNGFYLLNQASNFNRCISIANNRVGSGAGAGYFLSGAAGVSLNNCESQANRSGGIYVSSATDITFNNCLIGTKGTHSLADLVCATSVYATYLFNICTFGSSTLISGYTSLIAGSVIRLHKMNGTDNNHVWYTNTGKARPSGSGLTDTTTRTSGSLALSIEPEDNTNGFVWQFQIPAFSSSIVNFYGYLQKDAAFGSSTARVDLYLPGLVVGVDTPSDTQTLTNDTGTWQAVSLSANNTSNISGLANVVVTAICNTAGANLYVDDLYNSGDGVSTVTNKLASMDIWNEGKPANIISSAVVSAADVWTFSTENLTSNNTTGRQLMKLLTLAKFIGLG